MTRGAALLSAAVVLASLGMPSARATDRESSEAPVEAERPDGDRAIAARQILVTFEQRAARRLPSAGSTPRAYGGRKSYRTSPRASRLAHKLARDYGLRHVDGWPIEMLDVHCVVYEVPTERSTAEVLERLSEDPRVESAQPMQLFEVLGHESYNDPHFPLQHGLHAMQIAEAHRWSRGAGVRVAVVDTGVDVDHPELDGRVALAENFVDDDALAFTRDVHGTAVAGVIASRAGNGIGIVGVAPAVKVLALKACWERAADAGSALCSSFTLAKAISFAVSKRADVLNLSLTGPPDPLLTALLARAIDRGVIVVTAVADGVEAPGFPASLDRVLAVEAADAGTAERGTRLEPPRGLRAPGLDVLTIRPHALYDFMSGSSLAAAHVSGVAALLLEQRPKMSYDALHDLLDASSRTAGATGSVNACAALAQILTGADCPVGPASAS